MTLRVKQWPCIFRDPRIRTQVNPTLAKLRPVVPFAALQSAWRQRHCVIVNPYGSSGCPYRPEQCLRAYFNVAEMALAPEIKSPVGFFRSVAARRAMARVEHKPAPESRIIDRTDAQATQEKPTQGGLGGASGEGIRQGRIPLRRASRGPQGIGALLGGTDTGSRQGRPADEREGS